MVSRAIVVPVPTGRFRERPANGAAPGIAFAILGWLLGIVVVPQWILFLE